MDSRFAKEAVDTISGWLVSLDMTNGNEKPLVGCFRDVMNGGQRVLGLCDDEGIVIADD